VAIDRDSETTPEAIVLEPPLEPAAIAAQVADEPMPPVGFGDDEEAGAREVLSAPRAAVEVVSVRGAGDAAARGDPEATVELQHEPDADIEVDIDVDVEVDIEAETEPDDTLAPPAPPAAPAAGPPQDADRHVDQGPPAVPLAVGEEPTTVDIEDPLAFLEQQALPPSLPDQPSPWEDDTDLATVEVEVDEEEGLDLGDHDLEIVDETPAVMTGAAIGPVVDEVEVEVMLDEDTDPELAPSAGAKPPASGAREGPARSKSTIDLSEIDALLADLNLDRK
jgi:hypothetical protein